MVHRGVLVCILSLLFLFNLSDSVFACGGVTATIAGNPDLPTVRTAKGPGGVG